VRSAAFILVLLLGLPGRTVAAEAAWAAELAGAGGGRPKIGLVLSGGGARGAAHVGVLKVLERERIPIDAIAGTSMGALVGGLFASGLTANEIGALIESAAWRQAFVEPSPRNRLSFRRKREQQNFLIDFPLGLESGEFRLPKGLISEQRLTQLLRRVTFPVARIKDFDDLPTPFRAVATDLETGEPVELGRGELVTALRASLAAPGAFAPVDLEGRLLVDGGLANNLPVEVARRMGVDVLIVVDVGFPLRRRDTLDSVANISNQMLTILIRRSSDAQKQTLRAGDILISPQLGEASSFDFGTLGPALELGETAARAAAAELAPLQLSAAGYAQFVAARSAVRGGLPHIAAVEVAAESRRYERLLRAGMRDLSSADGLDAGLTTLYSRGNFESVDYALRAGERGDVLELRAQRNSWGPNYVRFGLNIEDDFRGSSRYNAAARFVLADIGELGAEWVWDLQVGSSPKIATELHLPVGDAARWFTQPSARYEVRDATLLQAGKRRAEYRLRSTEYGLDLGRELGNWGEWRAGLRRITGESRLRVGDPQLPNIEDFDLHEVFGRFAYDDLDNRNFPRHGQFLVAEWRAESAADDADLRAERVTVDWLAARSSGRHTGVLWTSVGTAIDGEAGSIRSLFPVGGFLNLSGIAPDSLADRHFAITRLMYYRQIGRGGEGFLDLPAYVGLSLEAGNVWRERGDMSLDAALWQGSLFFGVDTLLGPVYLGSGFGESGETAFYLFLGRTF